MLPRNKVSLELEITVPCPLGPAQILQLSGIDAREFAQAQFTSDVNQLSNGAWQWSAWLDAKGRVRHVFALLQFGNEGFLAWLPRGQSALMAEALQLFVFRSKVKLLPLVDYQLVGDSSPTSDDACNSSETWSIELPGIHGRRTAIIRKGSTEAIEPGPTDTWIREDIACGLPWVCAENAGQFTTHALGLDRLHAISLSKGCYPGQEIVARLHYRGGNKRECARLQIETATLPKPATEIQIETSPPSIGHLLYAAHSDPEHCEALAVLPLNIDRSLRMTLPSGARINRLEIIQPAP